MRAINSRKNAPLFVPDFVADSVSDIDFAQLKKRGVEYVAFDADSTLVGYRKKLLDVTMETFLKKELKRFKAVCIASNRVTNDLDDIAAAINAEVIRASLRERKPSVAFFHRVVAHFDTKPPSIAMIGDKLIADIYGGNKAGFTTVWVKTNGRDSIFDRVLQTRRIEKRLTKKHIE